MTNYQLSFLNPVDVCQPIKENDRYMIHRIIKSSNKRNEVQKIITELETDEKSDKKLIENIIKYYKKEDYDGLINYLKFRINQLKYRSTGKFHTVCKGISTLPEDFDKHPNGAPLIGEYACATKKMDGTQVQVGIFADTEDFCLLSHNGSDLINVNRPRRNGAILYQLEDLEPYVIEGHSKHIEREFQGGSLTKNFIPLIPQLQKLVKDYQLKEAWFYFELTFAVGKSTPKKIRYDDSLMNRCYLFCMTYNLYDELEVPEHAVKITVNSYTLPLFNKYGIPTVDIVFETDSFQVSDFNTIMNIVHSDTKLEGVILAQKSCYLKLLTHFFTETVEKYSINDKYPIYQELQEIYHKYLEMRETPESKKHKKTKNDINWKFIDEEFDKELSHNDWTHDFTIFYEIPAKESQKIYDCVQGLEFTKNILKSLADELPTEFGNLSKKTKQRIILGIKNKIIKDKKTIKQRFNISS